MTTIYRVVWQKDEILSDRGGFVEFLDLLEAKKYRDENYSGCDIEVIEKDLEQNNQVEFEE